MSEVKRRRPKGGGSVFLRKRDGLWIGCVKVRGVRYTTASSMYCDTLAKFKTLKDELRSDPAVAFPRRADNAPLSLEQQAQARATHTRGEWAVLYLESRGLCFYCGKHANPPEKDHKIPISRGGSDGIDNIAVSCVPCNRTKGSFTADEIGDSLKARG